MTQHHYPDADAYRAAQVEGNARKIHRVWALEENIRWLAENVVPDGARVGICHGTRTGREAAWFGDALPGCHVMGTDIGPSAETAYHTIRHDFHEPIPGIVGCMDFVYSNSHDHARDPERALRTWLAQLRPGGVLILEHTDYHEQITDYNCWAISADDLVDFLSEKMGCRHIYHHVLPARHPYLRYCVAVVVRA